MGLAPFFDRVWGAVGGHLGVSRASLTSALEDVTVGVHIGPGSRQNDSWTAELSTNLLARLYPRLALSGSNTELDKLRALARNINPTIEIVSESPAAATIVCGSVDYKGGIHAGATGWVAHLHHESAPPVGPANPYAAGAAACLACAELFRRIFLKSPPESDVSLSLLDYGTNAGARLPRRAINIRDVLFIGVGAVGNAALWCLARDTRLRGRLYVIDPEKIELSNLQRYVLTALPDVDTPKVELAQRVLTGTELAVVPHEQSLEQFAEAHNPITIPVTVVSVDNVDGRRSAQALLPRLVVNGWTGGEALGASWHVFSRDAACLACLYHPRGQGLSAVDQAAKTFGLATERAALLWVTNHPLSADDIRSAASTLGVAEGVLNPWRKRSLGELYTDVACGAVPLDVGGLGKVETVPLAHQSALAGILMAAELIKRSQSTLNRSSQTESLVTWDNVLRSPPKLWTRPRAREPGCICGDPIYQDVYREKWGKSSQKEVAS